MVKSGAAPRFQSSMVTPVEGRRSVCWSPCVAVAAWWWSVTPLNTAQLTMPSDSLVIDAIESQLGDGAKPIAIEVVTEFGRFSIVRYFVANVAAGKVWHSRRTQARPADTSFHTAGFQDLARSVKAAGRVVFWHEHIFFLHVSPSQTISANIASNFEGANSAQCQVQKKFHFFFDFFRPH